MGAMGIHRSAALGGPPVPKPERTTVTLDAVVFEDGELLGPDKEDIAGELTARKLPVFRKDQQ